MDVGLKSFEWLVLRLCPRDFRGGLRRDLMVGMFIYHKLLDANYYVTNFNNAILVMILCCSPLVCPSILQLQDKLFHKSKTYIVGYLHYTIPFRSMWALQIALQIAGDICLVIFKIVGIGVGRFIVIMIVKPLGRLWIYGDKWLGQEAPMLSWSIHACDSCRERQKWTWFSKVGLCWIWYCQNI